MDRRTAIKQISILGGAALLAPSCTFSQERVSVALDNLNISGAQEALLADIVETFIPSSNTNMPGARALKLHHFVLVMVDDCRGKADQEAFERGLSQVDAVANEEYGTSFNQCSTSQKEELIASSMEAADSDVQLFLNITKRYTVQGFLQSEYFMTEVEPYQLVPGHFDGCVEA